MVSEVVVLLARVALVSVFRRGIFAAPVPGLSDNVSICTGTVGMFVSITDNTATAGV